MAFVSEVPFSQPARIKTQQPTTLLHFAPDARCFPLDSALADGSASGPCRIKSDLLILPTLRTGNVTFCARGGVCLRVPNPRPTLRTRSAVSWA
eukprot:3438290-Rhodomonas_salina.1